MSQCACECSELQSKREIQAEIIFLRDHSCRVGLGTGDAVPDEGDVEINAAGDVDFQSEEAVMRETAGVLVGGDALVTEFEVDLLGQLDVQVRLQSKCRRRVRLIFAR